MPPQNLDHLRREWISRGSYETAWVTPGHLCPYQYGRGAAVRPQTNGAIWDGVIGFWDRVAPLLSPLCARGDVPAGANLNGIPVQDHVSLGTTMTNPCSGHRISLSSLFV